MPIDVQVIERLPHPDGLVVRVQINNVVPRNLCFSRIARKVCKRLIIASQQEQVPVGQRQNVMVKGIDGKVITRSAQPLVKVIHRELTDDVSRQIDFLHRASAAGAVQNQQHVAIWQQLDRLRYAEREIIVIVPDDVAGGIEGNQFELVLGS